MKIPNEMKFSRMAYFCLLDLATLPGPLFGEGTLNYIKRENSGGEKERERERERERMKERERESK